MYAACLHSRFLSRDSPEIACQGSGAGRMHSLREGHCRSWSRWVQLTELVLVHLFPARRTSRCLVKLWRHDTVVKDIRSRILADVRSITLSECRRNMLQEFCMRTVKRHCVTILKEFRRNILQDFRLTGHV